MSPRQRAAAAGAQECRLYRVANRADQLLAQSAPPDTSYTQATLRPEYTRCVQDARGMDDQLEACDTAELAHHKALLEAQVARLMDGPDGPAKDRWMDEQANWAADTDKHCSQPLTVARRWMHSRASSIVTPTVRWNCRRACWRDDEPRWRHCRGPRRRSESPSAGRAAELTAVKPSRCP
jgi:hypothetical protein